MSLDKQQIDAFGDSARDLLSRVNHAERLRERISQPPALDRDFWQEMAEAGWLAVLVPEEQGGLGLGLGEINAIAREMGAALPAEPLVSVAVQTVTLLCSLPPGPLRDRLLAGIADGSLVAGTAWQQRPGQVQAGPGAVVSASEGALSVSGHFIGVSPATGASGWLILAREQEE